jgi:hypothetical protein
MASPTRYDNERLERLQSRAAIARADAAAAKARSRHLLEELSTHRSTFMAHARTLLALGDRALDQAVRPPPRSTTD